MTNESMLVTFFNIFSLSCGIKDLNYILGKNTFDSISWKMKKESIKLSTTPPLSLCEKLQIVLQNILKCGCSCKL